MGPPEGALPTTPCRPRQLGEHTTGTVQQGPARVAAKCVRFTIGNALRADQANMIGAE
jgi:hypothetical protein